MSDDALKIIPTNPQFVPKSQARERAAALLQKLLPDGEMCEAQVYDEVRFIDQGANFEAVVCPACGRRVDLDSSGENSAAVEWWERLSDRMDTLDFTHIQSQMPCCGAIVPLTSLTFDWPAGFARFELVIWNPSIGRKLSADEMARFESLLGCRLSQIWAHY